MTARRSLSKPLIHQRQKSQIPSTKSQKNSNIQYPMTETVLRAILSTILGKGQSFGHCDLEFGALTCFGLRHLGCCAVTCKTQPLNLPQEGFFPV
jgi:hypothetical protein